MPRTFIAIKHTKTELYAKIELQYFVLKLISGGQNMARLVKHKYMLITHINYRLNTFAAAGCSQSNDQIQVLKQQDF